MRVKVVGATVAIVLVMASCSSRSARHDANPSPAGPPVTATFDGGNVSVERTSMTGDGTLTVVPTDAPTETLSALEGAVVALGPAIEVSLAGATLTGEATVTFQLPSSFNAKSQVPIVLWESPSGGFEPLATTWHSGDSTVSAVTTHFSTGFLGAIDAGKVAAYLGDWLKNLVTGRAGAPNPTCGDEAAARAAGVEVVSDGGDLVKWCFGRENGQDVVKVTNNWSAATSVSFPRPWTVVSYQGAGVNLQGLYDWADSKAGSSSTRLSRMVGAGQTIVLAPVGLSSAAPQRVVASQSIGSWSWSAAQTAVSMYFAVSGTLLRMSQSEYSRAQALVDSAGLAQCFTQYYGNEADPFAPVSSTSMFDTVSKATRFGLDCGKDIIQDALSARTGLLARIASIGVGIVAAVIGTVYSLAVELFSGLRAIIDQIGQLHDIATNAAIGGPGYDIVFTQGPPVPVVPIFDPNNLVYPAGTCGGNREITISGGNFDIPYGGDDFGPFIAQVSMEEGDLDADGVTERLVNISCSGGGNAVWGWSQVWALRANSWVMAATVPEPKLRNSAVTVQLVEAHISGAFINSETSGFAYYDATCCRSASISQRFRFSGSRLSIVGPTVVEGPGSEDSAFVIGMMEGWDVSRVASPTATAQALQSGFDWASATFSQLQGQSLNCFGGSSLNCNLFLEGTLNGVPQSVFVFATDAVVNGRSIVSNVEVSAPIGE